jgi:uncharacterized ion transporter superfamily protein YfcC
MIWGVALAGWDMGKMSALFLAGSIAVAVANRTQEEDLAADFIDGAVSLLGGG